MANNLKLIEWIAKNKQVGHSFSFEEGGELYWSSVAAQKWNGKFKVYVDEILDSQMACDNYLREEVIEFDSIQCAIEFISENTRCSPEKLAPCKGQKIFEP